MTFRGSIFFSVRDYLNFYGIQANIRQKVHLKITVEIRASIRNIHIYIGLEHVLIYFHCQSVTLVLDYCIQYRFTK